MKTARLQQAFISILAGILFSCSGSSASPELERAAVLVEHFTTPSVLSNSTFPVVLPDGTPKQFVSWLFSGMGKAEWPLTKAEAIREFGESDLPGMPSLPDGVEFLHSRPDTGRGKQIVVTWNDARGMVIVAGYLDPKQESVYVKEYVLPKVTSTNEVARLTARSNLEMGASFQAF